MDDRLMTDAALVGTIADLTVGFADREVLRDVEFDVPARSVTAVLGRSGSGKTTLLRSLNRLNDCLPGCRTRGSVRLKLAGVWADVYGTSEGKNGSGLSDEELRRRAGMVFQTPNVLPMSVERNMSLPLRLVAGLGKAELRERMERALREAMLWDEVKDRMREPAQRLSGGQRQRLCLARALSLEPEILLLDEPTASLDYVAAAKIEELLLRLKERYALVLVSHSLSQARRLADKAIVLREGTAVRSLERSDLRETGALEACFEETL